MRVALEVAGLFLFAWAWHLVTFHGFGDGASIRYGDWDQYCTFFEIQRRSLDVYGEVAHWNPYLLGGMPGAAHPQFTTWSPFFLPFLWLDVLDGAAWTFSLHVAVGVAGVYALARRVGHGPASAALAALIFAHVFTPFVSGGVVNRLNGSLLPWLVLAFLAPWSPPRRAAAMAVVIALVVLEGGFYILVAGVLVLGPLCLLPLLRGRGVMALTHIATCTVAHVVGVGLAAFRFVPTMQLIRAFPRDTAGVDAPWFRVEAFDTWPAAVGALLGAPHLDRRDELFEQLMFVGTDVGWVVLALLLMAPWYARSRWFVGLWFLGLLTVTLGAASPLNLWEMLRTPGPLQGLNYSMSLVFAPFLALALWVADAGRGWLEGVASPARARAVLSVGLIAAVLVPLGLQQRTLLDDHPRAELPDAVGIDVPLRQTVGTRSAMLAAVRRNEGVLDAYEEVIREQLSVVARPDDAPGARGGAWLNRPDATLTPTAWSPSVLQFDYASELEARLVINQNALDGWRAELDGVACDVGDERGLLAVELPAGDGQVTLSYRPPGWIEGCAASALFVLLWLGLWVPWRRRPHDGSTHLVASFLGPRGHVA